LVTLSTYQSVRRYSSEEGRGFMNSTSEVAVISSGPLACVILSKRWQFLGALAKLRRATISCVMSVRLSVSLSDRRTAWKNSVPTGRIFMKFYMTIFRKSVEGIQVLLNSEINNGYFA